MKQRGIIKAALYISLVIILLLLPLFFSSPYYINIFILTFMYIIVTSSLRLIATSSQISLGHAGFMGIGAYVSGIIAKYLGWTPWLTMPIGGLVTLVIAFLVGIPFSRLRGIYFSMVTLFFGIGVPAISLVFTKWTGGYIGLSGVPTLFSNYKIPYYYFFLILSVVSLLIFYRLEFSRIGLTWKSIAQSPLIASSIGINESRQRALVLAIGSFFAGIAGAGYVHYFGLLSTGTFNFLASINIAVYMLVGGIQSFSGPIVGTAILVILPESLRELKQYVPYIFSGIMLLVLFVLPKGVASLPEQIRQWIKKLRERKTISHNGGIITRDS